MGVLFQEVRFGQCTSMLNCSFDTALVVNIIRTGGGVGDREVHRTGLPRPTAINATVKCLDVGLRSPVCICFPHTGFLNEMGLIKDIGFRYGMPTRKTRRQTALNCEETTNQLNAKPPTHFHFKSNATEKKGKNKKGSEGPSHRCRR